MNKDCYTCKFIDEKDEEIAALNELGQEVATDCAKKDKELSKLRRQLEEKEDEIERMKRLYADMADDIVFILGLEEYPYSDSSGTDELIADWIEERGLDDDEIREQFTALCWKVVEGFMNIIKTTQTIIPPVERARWIEYCPHDGTDYQKGWVCSLCGHSMGSRYNKYCPNCGAKMDGGVSCG